MLIIISPAKRLDNQVFRNKNKENEIEFLSEAKQLVSILKKYKPDDLSKLMKISPKLGELNYERFIKWKYPFDNENAGTAIHMFKGDVYQGLDTENLNNEDLDFAQNHLRILSGLYGVLKPMDHILPYRLEMGTKLENKKGNDLYTFWGDKINKYIARSLREQGDDVLINLASNEYYKSVKAKELKAKIITPSFKENKDGEYKMVTFFAKKARGLMSRYIIKNKLTQLEDIKGFDYERYAFNEELSNDTNYVFTR